MTYAAAKQHVKLPCVRVGQEYVAVLEMTNIVNLTSKIFSPGYPTESLPFSTRYCLLRRNQLNLEPQHLPSVYPTPVNRLTWVPVVITPCILIQSAQHASQLCTLYQNAENIFQCPLINVLTLWKLTTYVLIVYGPVTHIECVHRRFAKSKVVTESTIRRHTKIPVWMIWTIEDTVLVFKW